MKGFIKFVCIFAIMLSGLFFISAQEASAKAKVYREYSLPQDAKTFPLTLSNGITIDKQNTEFGSVPAIKKGKTVIWSGSTIDPDALVNFSFTVTKNKDTYFYFHTGYRDSEIIEIIGVSAKGEIFSHLEAEGYGRRMMAKFLSPSVIEIGAELENEYSTSQADLGSGIFESSIYQLYVNGNAKEIAYIDKEFGNLAKKGQIKGVAGSVGGTFKQLKAQADAITGYVQQGETHISYDTDKAYYAFMYGSNYNKITNAQKIRAIYKDARIIGTHKTLGPALQKQFGKHVFKGYNFYVYKAGAYFIAVQYEGNLAQIVLMDKWYYSLVKQFNL